MNTDVWRVPVERAAFTYPETADACIPGPGVIGNQVGKVEMRQEGLPGIGFGGASNGGRATTYRGQAVRGRPV